MRRRQLVATATAGALASALAMLAVTSAPLLARQIEPSPEPKAVASSVKRDRLVPSLRRPPLVIGHRGASAYHAEHTLEAYRLAIEMGADYVEADLVVTSDGQLVARHENELSATTDVARRPEFALRRTTKDLDGGPRTGWFTEDFTLAELKTLRATPRAVPMPPGSALRPAGTTLADTVPSLQEMIDLVRNEAAALRRPVGLYLELKLPSYFSGLGLAPEPLLADVLRHNQLDGSTAPVFVESFDAASLRTLHSLAPAIPLIQLIGGESGPNDAAALADVQTYARGVGVDRARLRGLACGLVSDRSGTPSFIEQAHRAGLEVHVYTFANTTVTGPIPAAAYRSGDPEDLAEPLAEYRAYFQIGVDGVFTDNPDAAVRARGV